MEDCQRVENVFGSLQSEFIFIRSILLWKQPVNSFFAFCVLNFIGSYCTSGFFRYNVCCIVLCVLLLCLSLWVLPKVKLSAAIQRGQTSAEEKKRFEEGTLSYQRFCCIIALTLKYAEPHWGNLQKLFHTWSDYFLQTHFVISIPVAGFLVHLSLTGIIHILVVSSWIVFLCSLWMPLQYYGIKSIICDILGQFFSHGDTNMAEPAASTDAIPLPHTYICSHYLMGGCTEARYCTMHHLKKPYQWIYFYERKWWMVNDDDNDQLETCFCTPDVTEEILDLNLSRVTFGIRTRYFLSFDAMTIFGEIDLPIKRLSTKSQAELPGCSVATKSEFANGKAESPSNSTNTVVSPLHLKNDTKGVSLDKSSPPQGLKTEFRTLANEIQTQKLVTASVPSLKKKLKPASIPATSHKNHGSKRPSAPSRQIGIEKTAPHYLNVTTPLNTVPQRVAPGSDNTDAIPLPHTYICSHYLMGGCTEARYCTMHHLKKPYQWIYFYRRKWWMVNDDDNDQLETCFCTPDVTEESLDLNLSRVTFGIHTRYFLSFDAMTIFGEIDLPIKRLSTKSQAELPAGCSVATKWCWYWKNGYENFEEYKFQEGNASQELERQYLRGESSFEFQVAMHRYKIYFKKSPMYQTNLNSKTKREVRRRPCLSSTQHKSASSIIWNVMEKKKERKKGAKDKEGYTRVELKPGDSEYRDIKCLFMRTFHSHKNPTVLAIESIERVENQSLWEKYSSTYMDSSGHDANERFLFHGTREQSVEGICKTNFDWRMSGESVGAIYGEATYFATDAAKSHHYTLPDSNNYRYMFVALVLIGSYTRGKKGLRIPPPKDPKNTYGDRFHSCVDNVQNPKIFAIFDKNQCYPAYLVKYSAQPIVS